MNLSALDENRGHWSNCTFGHVLVVGHAHVRVEGADMVVEAFCVEPVWFVDSIGFV